MSENSEQVSSPTVSKQPSRGMPKKTFLLIALLAFAAIALVFIALSPKNKSVTKNPTPTEAVNPAQTTLMISPNLIRTSTQSASYKTDITINTGQNKVTGTQLELSFDPEVMTNVDIVPGTFFDPPNVLLKTIDEENGRITYALAIPLGQKGITGQGVLANLSFTLIGEKQVTTVEFLPKTDVSAENISESVLKSSLNGLFNLDGLVPSPFLLPIGTNSAN